MSASLLALIYLAIGAQFVARTKSPSLGSSLVMLAFWLLGSCVVAWLAWFNPKHPALVWKVRT